MHTLMVLAGGFVLLGLCLLTGKVAGGSSAAMAKAALVFLPLWLIGAGVNMWVGVSEAGYTVKDELPIFLVIFAVPAVVALVVWWKCKAH
jgi:hypothetical protein